MNCLCHRLMHEHRVMPCVQYPAIVSSVELQCAREYECVDRLAQSLALLVVNDVADEGQLVRCLDSLRIWDTVKVVEVPRAHVPGGRVQRQNEAARKDVLRIARIDEDVCERRRGIADVLATREEPKQF